MRFDDLDRKLTQLHQASERVAANLVELEIDSGRRLLEASTLSGESAARWSAASSTLTDLWRWRELLEQLLERADKLRAAWRGRQLGPLLEGQSIELASAEVPLAERDLLSGPEKTIRCSPDQLLVRMSQAFDEVKTVVSAFARAWEMLTPRLDSARRLLDESSVLAAELGEPGRPDLDRAARRLADLSRSIATDPLSTAPTEVDALIDELQDIHADLDAAIALRRDLGARIDGARAALRALEAAAGEARAAHEEALVKIAVPSAPPAPELDGDLSAELDRVTALARSGSWRAARRALDEWTSRVDARQDEARRALRANRTPIEARNQLRALLEAYQVKAARLGMIEDPELEGISTRAHKLLFTAPTDLAAAAQLVRRYQELLSGGRAEKGPILGENSAQPKAGEVVP